MAPFSLETWLVLAGLGALCVIAFLHALASQYREQTNLHDLKMRVHDLRREYAERMAREAAEEIIEVEPVVAPASGGSQTRS
jgi:hypothetical protein